MRGFVLLGAAVFACSPAPVPQWSGAGGKVASGTGGQEALGGTTGQVDTGGIGGSGAGGAPAAGGTIATGGATTGAGGSSGPKGNCHDGIKNQDETDADCGGNTCAPRCALGKMCSVPGDCVAATPAIVCDPTTNKCTDPCADNTQDGDETGVDCGGSCPLKCIGDPCKADSDCQSDTCDTAAGKCIATNHPLANINQACWDGLAGFNPDDRSIATSKYVPCMLANACCKKPVNSCNETCFSSNDGACGVNKMGGGGGPHSFLAAYYQKCVP